jgi:hypothetical protein
MLLKILYTIGRVSSSVGIMLGSRLDGWVSVSDRVKGLFPVLDPPHLLSRAKVKNDRTKTSITSPALEGCDAIPIFKLP